MANKPIVFLDREISIEQHGLRAIQYVAHNVGTGLAVNCYAVKREASSWSIVSIGAIEPGGRRLLPAPVEDPLRDHQGGMPSRLLVTEAVKTRTQQWIVTVNVLDQHGGVRGRTETPGISDRSDFECRVR